MQTNRRQRGSSSPAHAAALSNQEKRLQALERFARECSVFLRQQANNNNCIYFENRIACNEEQKAKLEKQGFYPCSIETQQGEFWETSYYVLERPMFYSPAFAKNKRAALRLMPKQ